MLNGIVGMGDNEHFYWSFIEVGAGEVRPVMEGHAATWDSLTVCREVKPEDPGSSCLRCPEQSKSSCSATCPHQSKALPPSWIAELLMFIITASHHQNLCSHESCILGEADSDKQISTYICKNVAYQIDVNVIEKNKDGQEVHGVQWCWTEGLLFNRIASNECSNKETWSEGPFM